MNSFLPSTCEAYGDVRLLPSLSGTQIRDIIQDQLCRLGIQEYQLDDLLDVPAVGTDYHTEIVQHLAAAVETVTGKYPRIAGSGPACDGWMFVKRGIPTVCGYGVRCGGVHGADEWVELASLRTTAEVYARVVLNFFAAKRS